MDTISEDRIRGADTCHVTLWPGPIHEPRVLKRHPTCPSPPEQGPQLARRYSKTPDRYGAAARPALVACPCGTSCRVTNSGSAELLKITLM